jgi:hypothetical protein
MFMEYPQWIRLDKSGVFCRKLSAFVRKIRSCLGKVVVFHGISWGKIETDLGKKRMIK